MKTRKIAAVLAMAITLSCTSAVATFIGNPTEVQAGESDTSKGGEKDTILDNAKKLADNHWYGKKETGFDWYKRPAGDDSKTVVFDAMQAGDKEAYMESLAYLANANNRYFNVGNPSSKYYCIPDHAFRWIASQPDANYYFISYTTNAIEQDENGFCVRKGAPSYIPDYGIQLQIHKADKEVSDVKNGKIKYVRNQPGATQYVKEYQYFFKIEGDTTAPTEPEKPVEPETPVNPPVDPETPEQPTNPETPVDPEEPTTPDEEKPETPDEEKPAEKPETPDEEKPAEEAEKEEGNLPKTGGIAAVTLAALGVACTVGGVYMTKNKKRR